MSDQVLAALAILKTNWERLGRDYVANFVPFVAEILARLPDRAVSLPSLQKEIRELFGLALPQNGLRHVLKRAAKEGYLRREQGVFIADRKKCKEVQLLERRDAVLQEYQGIVEALREYAAMNHDLEWSAEEAQDAILEFAAGQSLTLLFESKSAIPIHGRGGKRSQLVVGSFIQDARANNAQLFDAVEALAKGKILADSLYLTDPGRSSQKFRKTRLYLDTQVILFLCGYAGPAREAPCLELLSLLESFGAEVFCFRQTVEEVHGILHASAIAVLPGNRNSAYGLTVEYFLSEGMSSGDVELLSAQLPSKLRSLRIKVEDSPPFEREYIVDEKGFEDYLQETIGYTNPKARVHDVDCVSAIARLRRGRESVHVETCHALFVTTNADLARAARLFFQPGASEGVVPLCMTDHALGNLMWLKNPVLAPDLPAMRLMADAFAAMDPPIGLWARYLAEIARLRERDDVSADEYYLLRYSLASKKALIDLTDGSLEAFSEGTVAEVLEMAKRHLRQDLEGQVSEERVRRGEAERRIESFKHREEAQKAWLDLVATRVARVVARVTYFGSLILLTIGTVSTLPWSLPQFGSGAWRYGLATIQVGLLVYTVVSMERGTSVRDIALTIEKRVAGMIRRFLRSGGETRGGA